jgi:tRNA(Ile)-lysidine synthase
MKVVLPKPGKYVIAVSGGVDSVALLHNLHGQQGFKLIVAHFDHGIRPDSGADRLFVRDLAKSYGLPFVYDEGQLGKSASEAAARTARYAFLRRVQRASGAGAIITAHHQDDALETAIINLLRGSGRKGLTALASRHDVVRPLLDLPKSDLVAYARDQGLVWREDSTNQDQTYLRNYVRHRLMPRFNGEARGKFWDIVSSLQTTNHELDNLLVNQLHQQNTAGTIDRQWFNHLPHDAAREVLAAWLRAWGAGNFNRKTLERAVVAAKVGAAGKVFQLPGKCKLRIGSDYLALAAPER